MADPGLVRSPLRGHPSGRVLSRHFRSRGLRPNHAFLPMGWRCQYAATIRRQQRGHQPRRSRLTAHQRATAIATLFSQTPSGPASYQPPTTPAEILRYTITMAGLVPRGIRCIACPRASIGAGSSSGCFFSLTGNLNPTRTVGKVTDLLAVNGLSSCPPPTTPEWGQAASCWSDLSVLHKDGVGAP